MFGVLVKYSHSCQISSFSPFEGSASISPLHLDKISLYCNAYWGSHTKIILKFPVTMLLPLSWETNWCFALVINARYIVFFIVSRSPTKIQLSIQVLLVVIGRVIRNACLSTVNITEDSLFDVEPIANIT